MLKKVKNILIILILILLILLSKSYVANAIIKDEFHYIDLTQLERGVIKARTNTEVKSKLVIEKDNKRYTYNLYDDFQSFPLQLGNGDYKISIFENIHETKYRQKYMETITLDIDNNNLIFLNSIQNINWENNSDYISKAKELVKGITDNKLKVEKIYKYIVNNYDYDFNKLNNLKYDYLPDLNIIYDLQKGICYDYSSLFASMLRSLNIPTKLVTGFSDNIKGYHAWNEVLINDNWIIIDTTYDSQLKKCKDLKMIKSENLYEKVYEY